MPVAETVVLDTNVVLDLWVFRDPRCRPVAAALAEGRMRWIASDAMREELEHVLARETLAARWPVDTGAIHAAWQAHVTPVTPLPHPVPLHCSDRADQKFIDLALAHGAAWLFTRDRALLKLARRARPHGISIATPQAFGAPR